MRPEIVAADRQFEVRRAATLWRRAGEIDSATEQAIARLYPDDRVRTTRVFRVLFFFFTWFGWSSAYGMGSALFLAALGDLQRSVTFAAFHLVSGLVMLVVAELLHTRLRLRRFGVEEAAVWIGIGYVVGGGLWLFHRLADPSTSWMIGLGAWAVAATGTLAAWRWGTPATGFLAATGLFVALTQLPASHLAWLTIALLAAWPLAHLSMAAHISPQGRRRFREAFLVVSVAAYLACHVQVVEFRLFWRLRAASWSGAGEPPPAPDGLVLASLLAMAILPLVWIGFGVARRYRPAIDLGAILLLATIATFAFRAQPRPEWLFLLAGGIVLVAAALLLRRFFVGQPGAEWRGLTALALAEDRGSAGALETLAVLAAFAPAARPLDKPGFEMAGGEFGGGGASAKF